MSVDGLPYTYLQCRACNPSRSPYMHLVSPQNGGDRDVHPVGNDIVASYNWGVDNDRIFVPGYPPVIVPSRVHERFKIGKVDKARGHDRPSPCLEDTLKGRMLSKGQALIAAVKMCSPVLDVRSVDVIVDRFTLMNLLRFCGSPGDRWDVFCFRYVCGHTRNAGKRSHAESSIWGVMRVHILAYSQVLKGSEPISSACFGSVRCIKSALTCTIRCVGVFKLHVHARTIKMSGALVL